MTNYAKMERDYISRTLEILKQYDSHILPAVPKDQQYEVTLLMNCLLGLLIYPQQLATKKEYQTHFNAWLTTDFVTGLSPDWGIKATDVKSAGYKKKKKKKVKTEVAITISELTIRNLVRQMRNTVAHASFKVNDSTYLIERIEFIDTTRLNGFHMELQISDLKKFVYKLAETALARIPEDPIPDSTNPE